MQGQNIRDYADVHQLTVVANLEALNAKMIREKTDKKQRFIEMRKEAFYQLQTLYSKSVYTVKQIQSPFISSPAVSGSLADYRSGDFDEP